MSQCSTQAYASIELADPALSLDQIVAYLHNVISAEALNDDFDADAAYGHLSDAFDWEEAFDPFLDGAYELADYFQLKLDDGTVLLDGVPLLNTDDHVTRWAGWVLFRQFGAGDVYTFSNETMWKDGVSRCFYEVDSKGAVSYRSFFSDEDDEC